MYTDIVNPPKLSHIIDLFNGNIKSNYESFLNENLRQNQSIKKINALFFNNKENDTPQFDVEIIRSFGY